MTIADALPVLAITAVCWPVLCSVQALHRHGLIRCGYLLSSWLQSWFGAMQYRRVLMRHYRRQVVAASPRKRRRARRVTAPAREWRRVDA